MGFIEGFLGTDQQKLRVAADPYQRVREPYLDWLKGQIGQPGESYQGQMVAPQSTQEAQSFDFLRKYGEGDISQAPMQTQSKKVISDTLTNRYDPTTSPYYQAVKAESAKNLEDVQKNIASNSAGAGRYWTGGRLKEQGEAATQNALGLNKVLGELALKERQNQLSVIPQALGIAQTESLEPLQKATAYQTLGALPREIEQAKNQAAYNEWLRANVEYPMQIGQMAGQTQRPPMYVNQAPSNWTGLGSLFRSNFDQANLFARKA